MYSFDNIKETEINDYLANTEIARTLTKDEQNSCEGKITETECFNVISNLKSNKSLGLDGLCQEFYKYFWMQLKDYYLAMVNEIFESGKMSTSMRRAVISLIFKKGNKRLLSNYRPISITNVDYKILAFVLANRLQLVLNSIISPEQTAYIKGRYMGTNCRYILDYIDYCQTNNTEGLICLLDYTKAFDSLNIYFLISCLKKFNFGSSFTRWIKILYEEPEFVIKNNGWLTRNITMKRGIRQGCPVSAMLFLVATEILSTKIKQSHQIYSITLHNGEQCSPILQYADDTALLLDGYNSLKNALILIGEFSKCSGLNLNMDKTETILLGPLINKPSESDMVINITTKQVKYLGIPVCANMNECLDNHWNNKIKNIENLLCSWKQRFLTMKGKILILKALALPMITMHLSLLPIKQNQKLKLKRIFFNFIWKSTERIKRNTLIGDYKDGGLNMIDMELYENAIKASWIPKLFGERNCLNPIGDYYFSNITKNRLLLLHGNFDVKSFKKIMMLPVFYRDALCNFIESLDKSNIMNMNTTGFLSQQIWYNKLFTYNYQCLDFPNWLDVNILYVKDLYDENGMFVTEKYIIDLLKNKTNWICEYKVMKKVFKHYNDLFECVRAKYINPKLLCTFPIDGKKLDINIINTKILYKSFVKKHFVPSSCEKKWSDTFNFEFSKGLFESIYLKKIKKEPIVKVAEFNYKLLQNLLVSNDCVNKWNKSISKDCNVCGILEDTKHKIFTCSLAVPVWKLLEKYLKSKLEWKTIVLGFHFGNNYTKLVEQCLSLVAMSIYSYKIKCKMKQHKICENGLKNYVKFDLRSYYEYLKRKHSSVAENVLNIIEHL